MTAEEFYRKSIYESINVDAEKVERDFKMSVEEWKQRHVDAIMKIASNPIRRMQEFAKLKCEEQRQICADNVKTFYSVDTDRVDEDSILNAPEPTM